MLEEAGASEDAEPSEDAVGAAEEEVTAGVPVEEGVLAVAGVLVGTGAVVASVSCGRDAALTWSLPDGVAVEVESESAMGAKLPSSLPSSDIVELFELFVLMSSEDEGAGALKIRMTDWAFSGRVLFAILVAMVETLEEIALGDGVVQLGAMGEVCVVFHIGRITPDSGFHAKT